MTLPAVEPGALVVTFMDNFAPGILMGSTIAQCQHQSQLGLLIGLNFNHRHMHHQCRMQCILCMHRKRKGGITIMWGKVQKGPLAG